MEKEELIERAFRDLIRRSYRQGHGRHGDSWGFESGDFFNLLLKQGVAIESEVIQGARLVSLAPETEIHLDVDSLAGYSETYIVLPGHPLPKGKALVMILSLESNNEPHGLD